MRARIALLAATSAASIAASAAAQRVRPVLDLQGGYLVGVVVDGAWRDAEHGRSLVRGGERYRVFAGGASLGVARGARPKSFEEPCPETFAVDLSPEPDSTADVAVVGAWNVRPRPVTRGDPSIPAYGEEVRRLLASRGARNPVVRVTGVTRADLDGDGTEEAIVTAERASTNGHSVRAGDYSMIFVRKLVGGVPRTILLGGEYHPRTSDEEVPNTYTLGGVYDLDGDGVYEIVVRSAYYEGDETTVYRIQGTTAKELASAGCGA